MTDSPMLVREATTALPIWVSVPLLVWVVAVLVTRMVVLVDRRAVDRAAEVFVFCLVAAALLREPWIQKPLRDIGLALSDIRLLTHAAAIAAAVAVLRLGLMWREDRRPPRWVTWGSIAVAVGLVAVMALASLPARSAGVAIEELANWRTAAYMTAYGLATPLALIAVMVTAVEHVRERATWSRTLFGVVVALCAAASMTDHLTRLVSGLMLGAGIENGFTAARSESNDALFLPVLALAVVVAVPAIVSSCRVRLGNDPSSRQVEILAPMWSSLTEAVPGVRLRMTHGLTSPVEQEHRMRIEIEDAVHAVLAHLPVHLDDSPEANASALKSALSARRRGDTPVQPGIAPEWLHDEAAVTAVARAWTSSTASEDKSSRIPS